MLTNEVKDIHCAVWVIWSKVTGIPEGSREFGDGGYTGWQTYPAQRQEEGFADHSDYRVSFI